MPRGRITASIALATVLAAMSCSLAGSRWTQCPLPPSDFSEEDLAGTWVAKHPDFTTDTLYIRANHTYRQELHMTTPRLDYQGEWYKWYVETNEYGLMYLHLKGLRLYGYLPGLMEKGEVSGGDAWFLNFCEAPIRYPDGGEAFPGVQMPAGEAVLVVMGRPVNAILSPEASLDVLPVTDILGWTYDRVEP